MRITKSKSNLFEFDVTVRGPKKQRILRGLVDTGSSDCACTYDVITTLWARPVSFELISAINTSEPKRTLVYSAGVGFDDKIVTVPIIRVTNLPENIHFILGMSILSKCNLTFTEKHLEIDWSQ